MKTTLMNRMLPRVTLAGVCAGLALGSLPAQDNPPAERPLDAKPADVKPKMEKPRLVKPAGKKVPYLGIALGPVDESLAAQMNLDDGVGVLVRAVLPDSPAAKAGVQQHDLLHYFNDQLLINEEQLYTLVRQAGTGTEVTLKLLRKGKTESIVVKIGEHDEREGTPGDRGFWRDMHMRERAPGAYFEAPVPGPDGRMPGFTRKPGFFEGYTTLNSDAFAKQVRELSERISKLEGKPDELRKEIERFQKEVESSMKKIGADNAPHDRAGVEKKRMELHKKFGGPGEKDGGIRVEVFTDEGRSGGSGGASATATTDGKGNVVVTQSNSSRMVWKDGDGTGELVIEDGNKKLSVKDSDGKEIFSGPVNTDEQRNALPERVRERLERIEKGVKIKIDSETKGETL
jgi:hypothetical protein